MNRNRMGLALAATAWFVLSAAAAPAPTPPSEGPISDALALRAVIGKTAPPAVNTAVVVEKGVLEMETLVAIPVAETVVETVALPNGKQQQVARTVTSMRYEPRTERRTMDSIKFFTVAADGKLQPLAAGKAADMLKQKTPVLTGDSAEVDPRNLELVKVGALYLVLPPQLEPIPQPLVPPLPPGAKP